MIIYVPVNHIYSVLSTHLGPRAFAYNYNEAQEVPLFLLLDKSQYNPTIKSRKMPHPRRLYYRRGRAASVPERERKINPRVLRVETAEFGAYANQSRLVSGGGVPPNERYLVVMSHVTSFITCQRHVKIVKFPTGAIGIMYSISKLCFCLVATPGSGFY